MSHSVRRHLRLEIDEYDATIRRWIPGYETMVATAADAAAAVAPGRVVDLGSGTGALAEALLDRPGVGRVELVDVDPEMMARARTRLARFGDRAAYTVRGFDGPLPACEAITSSLALHHVPTLEAKARIFAEIHRALRPGGLFVNADATMPVAADARAAHFDLWAAHMGGHGIPDEQARAHFAEWAEEDRYLPLEAELAALGALGFEARQVWAVGPIGVVVARKG